MNNINSIIYPPYADLTLPKNIVNVPIISPFPSIDYTLPDNVCNTLLATLNTFGTPYDVGVSGYNDDPINIGKGSKRVSNYDPDFAKYLTEEISSYVPAQLKCDEYSAFDWQSDNPDNLNIWNFVGVSPLFRYMKYTQGSYHVPHYDSEFKSKQDPLSRTLFSGVLYLTTNKSGATAIINDGQNKLPFKNRNLSDWTRQATRDEIMSWSLPEKGKIIIFPHRLCHSVFPLLEDEERIIVRFDLFYSANK